MFGIAVSPCSNPELTLDEALAAYAEIGYGRFEAFTSWCKSAVDATRDAAEYLALAERHGFAFSSIHLPPLDDELDASIARAAQVAGLGAKLGCRAVLVKATSRENHITGGPELLDAIDRLPIVPVLQNHAGSAITTLDDYREVLDGIRDPRMKCTLEVGHFHAVGVSWREGYELLQGRIELVHIKDQVGPQSVAFGAGEIDLPGLLARLVEDEYAGDVVIEMEVEDRDNTIDYLREALVYVKEHRPQ